jgi:hypothetical protein
MTTQSYKRCGKCGAQYIYTGSGHGCLKPLNNSTWCPDCTRVVNAALANIPRKFEGRWTPIAEVPHLAGVTPEHIRAWEEAAHREAEERQAAGQIVARRVFSPLFNLQTGDSQNVREVRGRDEFQGHTFKVASWRQAGGIEIEVNMEYDLQNNRYTGHEWPRAVPKRGSVYPRES